MKAGDKVSPPASLRDDLIMQFKYEDNLDAQIILL